MKGIILAGGSGTRLHPITLGVSKQLLPIYDKPMIYYPLSVLMLAGIKDILIITTPHDLPNYKRMLGNGKNLGISIKFKVQPKPDGLAQAFILGEKFIKNENVCLILGDNIFYGHGLKKLLSNCIKNVEQKKTATVLGYYVSDPQRYGVVKFDKYGKVKSLQEKPKEPKSNFAVVGLYFYPNSVIKIAKKIRPSKRGELEITSVNKEFLNQNKLDVEIMGRGFAWLDTGTHDSLMDASNFIRTIESRQGLKVACLEVIAFQMGYINFKSIKDFVKNQNNNDYAKYVLQRCKEIHKTKLN